MNKNSVHLQDFPQVSGFSLPKDNQELVKQMDIVLAICSLVLFIRDQQNLRVRLPLQSLKIIGKNAKSLDFLTQIIAEEVNVKEIFFEEHIENIASFKLQLNFKKIGSKFKDKIKEITIASKENHWKQIDQNKIEIAGIILEEGEFELKLAVKQEIQDRYIIMPLSSNDYLVSLDIMVTPELEKEGIARDIIRLIQQSRKEKNLAVEDRIAIDIHCNNQKYLEALNLFASYIAGQVLGNEINIINSVEEINEIARKKQLSLIKHYIEQQEILLSISTI